LCISQPTKTVVNLCSATPTLGNVPSVDQSDERVLGQRDMRSFGNDDMSDRADNSELATDNSESENDNESA